MNRVRVRKLTAITSNQEEDRQGKGLTCIELKKKKSNEKKLLVEVDKHEEVRVSRAEELSGRMALEEVGQVRRCQALEELAGEEEFELDACR